MCFDANEQAFEVLFLILFHIIILEILINMLCDFNYVKSSTYTYADI